MVYVTYAQPKLKPQYHERINRIFNLVKTKATPDLWLKVLITRREIRYWSMHVNPEQIKFYFGDRFDIKDIQKQTVYKNTKWSGHYRWTSAMGFYDKEWEFIRRRPKIKHVITLKIGEDCSDKDIAMLIAHEFRHYLQYLKHGYAMIGRESSTGKRKRPLQVERDANKWMNKRVAELEARHLI